MKSTIAHLIDEEILNSKFPNETETEFIFRIFAQITEELSYIQKFTNSRYFDEICDEIEDQILEVYRIKTYGHRCLKTYKQFKLSKIAG